MNETFEWRLDGAGVLRVSRGGREVWRCSGAKAAKLALELSAADDAAAQLRLAAATGNYRRGNEGRARSHPRNRKDGT